MPWILGILSLIIILVLVFIDSSRRKGLRKASFVLLLSGLVLIASYLVNSSLINRVDNHIKNSHDLGSFKQASIELVSKVSSFLAKIDLWFGVAYILLALAIIVLLSSVRRQIKNDPDSDSKLDKESVSDTPKSESVASRININPRRSQHTLDIIGSTKRGNSLDPTKTASRLKSNPPKNRGRLIQ
jgi:preprotein translocase subunit SecG